MNNKSLKIFFLIIFLSMCITTFHVLNTATSQYINEDLFNDLTSYEYSAINNENISVDGNKYLIGIYWSSIYEKVIISPFGIDVSTGENAVEIPKDVDTFYLDLKIGGTSNPDYKANLNIAIYNKNKELIDLKINELTNIHRSSLDLNKLYKFKLDSDASFYKIYLEVEPLDADVSVDGKINMSYLDVYFD